LTTGLSGLPSATVEVQELMSLPERGRARLVAAELTPHPTLLELHRRLALRLAKNARARALPCSDGIIGADADRQQSYHNEHQPGGQVLATFDPHIASSPPLSSEATV